MVLKRSYPCAHLVPTACLLLTVALGLVASLVFLGPSRIDPTNTDWISDDFVTVQVGWESYRRDSSYLPPASSTSMAPIPINVAMYDGLPLVSFVIRHIEALLPSKFQFIGFYLAASAVLQAVLAFCLFRDYAIRHHSPNVGCTFALLASFFVAISPVMLWRWRGHAALASHWLLIASFWILLRKPETALSGAGRSFRQAVMLFSATGFVAGGINPYLLVMVGVIFGGFVAREWLAGLGGYKRILGAGIVFASCSGVSLLIFGFIPLGTGGTLPGGGHGYFSAHPLTLVYPVQGKSLILPHIPITIGGGQYEGYGYLGMGAIAMLVCALLLALRSGQLRSSNVAAFILIAIIGYILALTPRFREGLLARTHVVEFAMQTLEIFRASGRFIWLAYYTMIIGGALLLAKCLAARWLIAATTGFVLVQLLDLAPTYQEFAAANKRAAPRLKGELWKLSPAHEKLIVIPPFQCNPATTPGGVYGVNYLAPLVFEQKITTNSSYTGRVPRNQVNYHCREMLDNFGDQPAAATAAYVFSLNSFEEEGQRLLRTHMCELDNGFVLCRSGSPGMGRAMAEWYRLRVLVDDATIYPGSEAFAAMQFGWEQISGSWYMAREVAGFEAISPFEQNEAWELIVKAKSDQDVLLPPAVLHVYVAGAFVGGLQVGESPIATKTFGIPPGLVTKGRRFRIVLAMQGKLEGRVRLDDLTVRKLGIRPEGFDALKFVFNNRINDRAILMTNWSPIEPWGVWSDGARSALRIPTPRHDRQYGVRIRGIVFGSKSRPTGGQRLEVLTAGRSIFRTRMNEGEIILALTLPGTLRDYTDLEFRFPDAVALEELPNSWDRRRIALGIKSVIVHTCERAPCSHEVTNAAP